MHGKSGIDHPLQGSGVGFARLLDDQYDGRSVTYAARLADVGSKSRLAEQCCCPALALPADPDGMRDHAHGCCETAQHAEGSASLILTVERLDQRRSILLPRPFIGKFRFT